MHQHSLHDWEHPHGFGARRAAAAERRIRWVAWLTAAAMAAEVVAGTVLGSMALLADGWHMATHAAALGMSAFAYAYARRHAANPLYSFGTGKVEALAGFASAASLATVALLMTLESLERLIAPVAVHFDEALAVAAAGLAVNIASALILRGGEHAHPGHEDGHDHAHDHPHDHQPAGDSGRPPGHPGTDHNLRGAFLHVVSDALTSVLAIAALAGGRMYGWVWLDAAAGIVGAALIGWWAVGLFRPTSAILLDASIGKARQREIRAAIESRHDNRVADLHLWRVGPAHVAAILSVVTHEPKDPAHYKRLLDGFEELAHVTVEVNRCDGGEPCAQRHLHA